MIKPEPSRHVHFIPRAESTGPGGTFTAGQPHAAIITHVHSDRLVNLCVFDKNGWPVPKTSVPLVQPEDTVPTGYDYCRWMPFQIQTANKQAEKQTTV